MVLQFGAQPSDSLPAFITPFAHPVHVDSDLYEADPDTYIDSTRPEGQEINVVAPALVEGPSRSR